MAPRWESPFAPPSPRDTALLAEVLGALQAQLSEATTESSPSEETQELINAAIAELHRVSPAPLMGGVAPVLGSGVVQELLRRRREGQGTTVPDAPPTVDERL